MRNIWIVAFILVALGLGAQNRHALVMGNSSYEVSPLANPANDATDVAQALEAVGFAVQLVVDGNKRTMIEAVREFEDQLEIGDVALFFYAGHGVQVGGENYLIPVQANINTEADVEFEAVALSRVLTSMETRGVSTNIVLLDACRNNPYASSTRGATRGLTVVQTVTSSLIGFATAPGDVAQDGDGRNSPFTSALLTYMAEPGLEVEQLMKKVRNDVARTTSYRQTPWTNSSLLDSFYFIPPQENQPVAIDTTSRTETTQEAVQEPRDSNETLRPDNRPEPQDPREEREPRDPGDPHFWIPEWFWEEGRPFFPDGPPAFSGYFWYDDEVVFYFDPGVYMDGENFSRENQQERLTALPDELYVAGDFNGWLLDSTAREADQWRMEKDGDLYLLFASLDDFPEPFLQFKFRIDLSIPDEGWLTPPDNSPNRIPLKYGGFNLGVTTLVDPQGDPAFSGFYLEPGYVSFFFDENLYWDLDQLDWEPEEVFVVGDFSDWQWDWDYQLEHEGDGLWFGYFPMEEFEPGMQFKFLVDREEWMDPDPDAQNAIETPEGYWNLELLF